MCRPPTSRTPTAWCGGKRAAPGIKFADLLVGKSFHLKLDPKAPLKDPKDYTIVGKPLPRPDVLLLPGAVR
jgi:hypothetical protein